MDASTLFTLFSDRDKITRLVELISPALKVLEPALPQIKSEAGMLIADLAPDFLSTAPLLTLDVAWLQLSLNKLGAKLTVDGVYGQGTKDAVTLYKQSHGLLPVSDWADSKTCFAIIVDLAKLEAKK